MATLKSIKKAIAKFNAELEEYHKVAGDYNLPEIDTTIIGYSELTPYEITDETERGFTCIADGFGYVIGYVEDEDGEEYISGWDDGYNNLKDSIAYDRRRIRKAWRVWRSENPDYELEKDNEE